MVKVARFKTNLKQLILNKSARDGRRISYKEVAEETGLSEITISRWARGEVARLELETINSLCKYLGCTFEELIQFEPNEYDTPSPDEE